MAAMRILEPDCEATVGQATLAARPGDLNGKVLYLVDGNGEMDNGKPVMNRVFRAWKERLEKEFRLADVRWERTDNICTPFRHGKEKFAEISSRADIIINGVAM